MQEARIELFEYVYAYNLSYTNSYNIKVHNHICYPSEIVFTLQYINFSVIFGRLFTFL